jgi:hypothetical protein
MSDTTAENKGRLSIKDAKTKLWLGDDVPDGRKRYLRFRKHIRRYITRVKIYNHTDFGVQQWDVFTQSMLQTETLTPVRPYFDGAETPANKGYRQALKRVMMDVLKKCRASFHHIHGRYPNSGESVDEGEFKLIDDNDDEVLQ